MALTINRLDDQEPNPRMQVARERLYFTADQSAMVRENDPGAASLAVATGQQIGFDMAAKFGIKNGRLPRKRAEKPADKALKGTRNKKG